MDRKVPTPEKAVSASELPPAIVKEVEACSRKLGSESFRDRRKATKRLVEIGNFAVPKGANKTTPYRTLVRDKLTPFFSNPDPEVSQRARTIVKTLYPYGDIDPEKFKIQAHIVDQEDDTIEDIADDYDSKPEWIKIANPGLRTDNDLRKRKMIVVPVLREDDVWGEIE